MSIDGRQYASSPADLEQKGRAGLGKNTRSAEFLGGGALAQAVTKGSIRVEPETILVFKLDMPLRVEMRRQ